jgi:hypothetical protein
VHYFSDRCDPFKTVLPQLIENAGGYEERVFVVATSLKRSTWRSSKISYTEAYDADE